MYGKQSLQGRSAAPTLPGVRYDKKDHWLRPCDSRRRGYCIGKAKFYCIKCDKGLHPKCHERYQSSNSTVPIVKPSHCDSLLTHLLLFSKSKYYFTKGIAILLTLAIFY